MTQVSCKLLNFWGQEDLMHPRQALLVSMGLRGCPQGWSVITRAQTVKFWGSLNELLIVTVSQYLCKLGPGICIQKFRPVKSFLRLLGGIGWECTSVFWEFTLLRWESLLFNQHSKKRSWNYHKRKLPCLYEEDDVFFQLQINQLIQKSTTNRAVEHYARVPTL